MESVKVAPEIRRWADVNPAGANFYNAKLVIRDGAEKNKPEPLKNSGFFVLRVFKKERLRLSNDSIGDYSLMCDPLMSS